MSDFQKYRPEQRCERNERHNNTNETKRKVFKKPNVERIERRLKRENPLFFSNEETKNLLIFVLTRTF